MSGHIIHIGFPKAASSYLQEWFYLHPQLHFQHGKIAGFRNAFEICRFASGDLQTFPKHFVTSTESFVYPTIDTGKPVGVKNTNLKYYKLLDFKKNQKNACKILKEVFPEAKILILTRGFSSVLYSIYAQFISQGGKIDFAKFCGDSKTTNEHFYNYNYVIDLYVQQFGKSNVIVLPYEMLKENQDLFLHHLEEILEIDHFDFKVGVLNKSLSKNELFWHALIHSKIELFYLKFGKKIHRRLYLKTVRFLKRKYISLILKLIIKKLPEKKLDPENLSEKYVETIKNNATILREFPVFKPYLNAYNLPAEHTVV